MKIKEISRKMINNRRNLRRSRNPTLPKKTKVAVQIIARVH
jgi:hypothetical protein